MLNSRNPYVLDDRIFRNDSRLGDFQRLTLAHKWNHHLVAITSLWTTSTLLYLLLKKTPSSIKRYSRVLLLCCATDGFFLFAEWFCGARCRMTEGIYLLSFEGPAALFDSYYVLGWAHFLQVTAMGLSSVILPIQYFVRYKIVCQNITLSVAKTVFWFLVAVLMAMSVAAVSYPATVFSAECKPDYNYGELWYIEDPIPPLLIGDLCSRWAIGHFFVATLEVGGSYLVAAFFAFKTMEFLRRPSVSDRTRELQSQLTKALIVQTMIPLFLISAPILFIFLSTVIHVDSGRFGIVAMMALGWLPLLNSLSSIYFIVPYRRVFCRMLRIDWLLGPNPSSRYGISSSAKVSHISSQNN